MKKKVLIFSLLLCCFSAILVSQNSLNFELGITSSMYDLTDNDSTFSDDFNRKLGLTFGPTIQFEMNEKLSLQTGLVFQMRGYRQTIDADSVTSLENNFSFYYLDIPLLINYTFSSTEKSPQFFGSFGSYFGLALGGRNLIKTTRRNQVVSEDKTRFTIGNNLENLLSSFDFGLTVGGGIDLDRFRLGLYYDYGLTNISPDKSNGLSGKNRVLRATITLKAK